MKQSRTCCLIISRAPSPDESFPVFSPPPYGAVVAHNARGIIPPPPPAHCPWINITPRHSIVSQSSHHTCNLIFVLDDCWLIRFHWIASFGNANVSLAVGWSGNVLLYISAPFSECAHLWCSVFIYHHFHTLFIYTIIITFFFLFGFSLWIIMHTSVDQFRCFINDIFYRTMALKAVFPWMFERKTVHLKELLWLLLLLVFNSYFFWYFDQRKMKNQMVHWE